MWGAWVLRCWLKFWWRVFPYKYQQLLRRFASIELDSAWQLKQLLKYDDEPLRKQILTRQILEECSHSESFFRLYERESCQLATLPHLDREAPYKNQNEMNLYTLVGERSAYRKFEFLKRVAPKKELRELAAQILKDEADHIEEGLVLSNDDLHLMRRMKVKRNWQTWKRLGEKCLRPVGGVILFSVYFLLAPFFLPFLKRRRT